MRSNPSGKGSHIITKEEEVIRHSQDICPNHLSWPDWGSGWPRMFQNYRPLPSSNWRWFFIELRFASLSITMLVIIMRKRDQYKWKTSCARSERFSRFLKIDNLRPAELRRKSYFAFPVLRTFYLSQSAIVAKHNRTHVSAKIHVVQGNTIQWTGSKSEKSLVEEVAK